MIASQPLIESSVKDYWVLLKPRVMSLVVFTGLVGLLVAPGHIHPFVGFVVILAIAVGAGAAGALNMWYERDRDALMTRTAHRPLPQGTMNPDDALAFGMILGGGALLTMYLAAGLLATCMLAFTIFFYVGIYTVLLKPHTSQNIVIGGAAGAFPPIIGWLAVTNHFALEPWFLFGIIFLWTPPHFWALALQQKDDFKRAGFPMLPVLASSKSVRRHILVYTIILIVFSLSISFSSPVFGPIYKGVAVVAGAFFFKNAINLYQDESKAMALFFFSIFYLFALFSAILADYFVGSIF